mmetsp:Transcript_73572/g.192989  ORF Transcript_73572/g.192989 Transcript_73572/m.192989 type:complete len:251 (+) Transcript_73572:221-973(+)
MGGRRRLRPGLHGPDRKAARRGRRHGSRLQRVPGRLRSGPRRLQAPLGRGQGPGEGCRRQGGGGGRPPHLRLAGRGALRASLGGLCPPRAGRAQRGPRADRDAGQPAHGGGRGPGAQGVRGCRRRRRAGRGARHHKPAHARDADHRPDPGPGPAARRPRPRRRRGHGAVVRAVRRGVPEGRAARAAAAILPGVGGLGHVAREVVARAGRGRVDPRAGLRGDDPPAAGGAHCLRGARRLLGDGARSIPHEL